MRRAFTLLELLIAIAIIALLAALLFPVLAAGRRKAREAPCMSNLHQLLLAWTMYVDDSAGTYRSTCYRFIRTCAISRSSHVPTTLLVGRPDTCHEGSVHPSVTFIS
ncbi:MAG: hypothetical protein C4335_11360 [Armatimonadota bacterium]